MTESPKPAFQEPESAPFDLAIVGAGPIGIELHVAALELGLSVCHLEAGPLAATIDWFPRDMAFFSSPERIEIAGRRLRTPDQGKATRERYLEYLRGIVEDHELAIHTHERVCAIARQADGTFALSTARPAGGRLIQARKVVLAIGNMHRPRRLEVPGEDLPHVSHYFIDPHPYFGKDLLIVGARNSAVEAALRCHRAGARVTLSYRGEALREDGIKPWNLAPLQGLIESGAMRFLPSTRPIRFDLASVVLSERDSQGRERLRTEPCDFALLMTGYEMTTDLLVQLGIELFGPASAPRLDPETLETPVAGVYVAGTATAGDQKPTKIFIENCHHQVLRILRHITGRTPTRLNPLAFELMESGRRLIEDRPES